MPTMVPEIKTEFVRRLRSGEYLQGRGALATKDGNCCLGVLANMCVEAGKVSVRNVNRDAEGNPLSYLEYDDPVKEYGSQYRGGTLPPEVIVWSGIESSHGSFFDSETGTWNTLINLNDSEQLPFSEIANYVETYF